MTKYDAIIIGSGQSGTPLSKRLAESGLKTALIEKRWVGGTCINDGCTPTKALIASAKCANLAGRSKDYGVNIDSYSIDFKKIMQRQADIVSSFRDKSLEGLKEVKNLDLVFGKAEFIASHSLRVTLENGGVQELDGERIFIDTGTRTRIPEIEGLKSINYLTSTSILNLKTAPEHLLIIGGGYIGLEYGQMFRRFGCEVTIVDSSPRFLSKEDEDIAAAVFNIFEEDGIKIFEQTEIKKVEQLQDETISVTFQREGKEVSVLCSHILVATGRTSQNDLLNPVAAGIETDEKGFIKVNDKLETNVPGVYALGEANGGPAFTHISYNDYVIVSKNILENADLSTKGRPVPYCMFTDPQLGRIGITEKEAKEKGYQIKVACIPMKNVARAIETSETRGLIKAIVDAESKRILGASVLSAEGGEIMALFQLAMLGNITYEQLSFNIFAHPTYSESLNNLFMNLED